MIAAPVVFINNWVTVHSRGVAATTANGAFLFDKPHARFTAHTFTSVLPGIF
jgi:hypothetical protein